MKKIHAVVYGTVQGVGFRYFVMSIAEKHDLYGWVRNLRDGSVELEAEGEAESIQEVLRQIEKGNRFSEVQEVVVEEIDHVVHQKDFIIR